MIRIVGGERPRRPADPRDQRRRPQNCTTSVLDIRAVRQQFERDVPCPAITRDIEGVHHCSGPSRGQAMAFASASSSTSVSPCSTTHCTMGDLVFSTFTEAWLRHDDGRGIFMRRA